MAGENRAIRKQIEDAGYVLIRQSKHLIFRNAHKEQIVMPTGTITSPRFRKYVASQLKLREQKRAGG